MNCPKCNGSKHVRRGRSWVRCECASSITNSLYIKPNIRCGEGVYPPELNKIKPLPLKDITISGDYHTFRQMVWRSLSLYEADDLLYDYMDAYRLVEIFLNQDNTYSRVRDLGDLGLVVVVLGVSDLPNRMLAPLLCQLLTQRKMEGHPTWVYTSKMGASLRSTYGNELTDLLNPVVGSVLDLVGTTNSNHIDV